MEKTMLLAGKELPDCADLADSLELHGRKISAASNGELSDNADPREIEWNKSSPVSARALILQAEADSSQLDEAVLYFDEQWLSSLSGKVDAEECARCSDDYILGFQYLALEVLERFERKHSAENPGTLVFLLKETPCAMDVVRSPSLRNGINAIATPVIASCAAAFTSFAENVAALYGDLNYVNIVLVRGDSTNEAAASDRQCGSWLGEYLDSIYGLKVKQGAKKAIQWIRPGSKAASDRFSFFGRK